VHVQGIDRYVKRKKLDPLETYVPLNLEIYHKTCLYGAQLEMQLLFVQGIDRYVMRKKLDPLETYLPLNF
jgi:hypothetical protein